MSCLYRFYELSRFCTFKFYLQSPLKLCHTMNSSIEKFDLPGSKPPVPVFLPSSSAHSSSSSSPTLTKVHILSFPAFKNWIQTLQQSLSLQSSNSQHPFNNNPYVLRSIEVQAADFFGGRKLGFLKLRAEISNENGEGLPGSVFLRGGSVGMLVRVYNNLCNLWKIFVSYKYTSHGSGFPFFMRKRHVILVVVMIYSKIKRGESNDCKHR